jgi:hypothetical protein
MHTTDDQEKAVASWRGRWLRDGFENRLGCVRQAALCDDKIELVVAFPDGDRRVSTEERPDGEFAHPDSVRARYRVLSEEDARDFLRKARSASNS